MPLCDSEELQGATKKMNKCPKCDYRSENPGTCPTDDETLVAEVEETAETVETEETETPQATEESDSSAEASPETPANEG